MTYEKPVVQCREVADGFVEFFLPGKSAASRIDWRARKLKDFIDTHTETVHLNLEDVCTDLGLELSGRQARRLFKTSVRMGVREYVKTRRLALAAGQLQATNIPVKVIAFEAGYHSSRHFARSFKELFQVRPAEFRKIWGQRDFAA